MNHGDLFYILQVGVVSLFRLVFTLSLSFSRRAPGDVVVLRHTKKEDSGCRVCVGVRGQYRA